VKTPIRQAFMKSKGSITTPPPASRTFDAASSALSTHKYVVHIAIGGAVPGIDRMAATSPLCLSPDRSKMDEPLVSARAIKYLSAELGAITSSNSQPKRSP
jgi:hypothetical protein